MTDTRPPTPQLPGVTTGTIEHWVDGRSWSGSSTRTAPVFDPATGAVAAEVRLASAADVDHVVAVARARPSGSGARSSLAARTSVLFAFRELVARHRERARRRHHRRARQGARRRRSARSAAASRSSSSPAASRTCSRAAQRAGLHRRRRVLHPPAARRGRPASRRSTSRPWCRCGCSRSRSPAATAFVLKPSEQDPGAAVLLARLVHRGRPPGRRVQRGARATPRRSTRCSSHPGVQAVSFVGSTPIARHVYETGHRGTASACRRSAAPRTT